MANLLGELLFSIIRLSVAGFMNSFFQRAFVKVCAWLDPKIHGRWARIAVGLFLGGAAYFIFPVMASLLVP